MKKKNSSEGTAAVCRDCGVPFFTEASELEWLSKYGLQPYSRCPSCREKRRQQKAAGAMAAPKGQKRLPW